MTDVLSMVRAERRALADFLDTLSDEQWAQPSWCDKWTVQVHGEDLRRPLGHPGQHSPETAARGEATDRRVTPGGQ